jgi:hypothetical protein
MVKAVVLSKVMTVWLGDLRLRDVAHGVGDHLRPLVLNITFAAFVLTHLVAEVGEQLLSYHR